MKPGDHPNLSPAAPEGRSRESSIVLTKAGRFCMTAPCRASGHAQGLRSWLTRHPDDGRYILSNGYDWSYLTVEGAAYFVRDVRAQNQRPELELLDVRTLPLDPLALSSDPEGKLWVRLPEGEQACFTAAAQLALSPGSSNSTPPSVWRSPGSSRRFVRPLPNRPPGRDKSRAPCESWSPTASQSSLDECAPSASR